MDLAKEVVNQAGAMREFEKPEVCKAIKVANANKLIVGLSPAEWYEREARLKKEFEERSDAPVPGKEQPEEEKRIICCSASPKADFYNKYVLNEGNPALKESASQFNDALLDEQAKEIESLRDKCKKYADILDSVGDKLRELKAENRRIKDSDLNLEGLTYATRELKEKNKEIDKQNQEITRLLSLVEKKENSISRLYYEKSVLEKENEELKKGEIPARYFDKALVDEQSEKIKKLEHEKLDILEMASSCKQTIAELTKKNERLKDQVAVLYACKEGNEKYNLKQIKRLGKEIPKLNSIIHDKNAVLADVAEELRLSKIREKNLTEVSQKYMKENEELKKELADKVVDKIDAQALKSAESALAWKEKVVTYKDMALAYYEKKIAEKDEVIADLGKELAEAKKLNTAKILDINAKCMRAARESINDVFESYAAKYAKSTLDDLKDKAYESFNAKACNLGLVGSKNGNGIFDQMIGVDIAEEGGDHSAIIARCCKNIAISKDEAEIIERCTKDGTELHYSEKNGFTYTNMFGDEMPIICLRGMCQVFTDEEIKNMKK